MDAPARTHTGRRVCYCEACNKAVAAVVPRFAWRVAAVGAWLLIPVLAAVMAFTGFLAVGVVLLAPLMFIVGAPILALTQEEAFKPPTCADCGRAVSLDRVMPGVSAERSRGVLVALPAQRKAAVPAHAA